MLVIYLLHDKTGEADAYVVKCAVMKVAANFRCLGCALGLLASTLDEIETNNPRDARKALGQGIDSWLARRYDTEQFGEPSWRKLASAVASPAGGNNPSLALKIAEDHPGKQLLMTIVFVSSYCTTIL